MNFIFLKETKGERENENGGGGVAVSGGFHPSSVPELHKQSSTTVNESLLSISSGSGRVKICCLALVGMARLPCK